MHLRFEKSRKEAPAALGASKLIRVLEFEKQIARLLDQWKDQHLEIENLTAKKTKPTG